MLHFQNHFYGDDEYLKREVCKACTITTEEADRVCWSFPAKAESDAICSDEECAVGD